MKRPSRLLVCGAVLGVAVPVLFSARLPLVFLGLHSELKRAVDQFHRSVSAGWNGTHGETIFGAELLTANSHRGEQLLNPNGKAGVDLEMERLAGLGSRAVTIAVNFPILYPPFHQWRGKPGQYEQFLDFYRYVADSARRRNMRVIVESGILFPGPYSARSGFDVAAYYKTLGDTQFRDAKSAFVNVIVRELKPDFVNLGAEPDTETQISGKNITNTSEAFADLIGGYVRGARQMGAISAATKSAPKTMFGAGIGSWQRNGEEYIRALARTPLDYIDIHVYPVNGKSLENLTAFTDLAQSLGKQVAISEAWVLKEGGREYASINSVSDPSIFGRDGYSFWAPLDQEFLGALVKFAAWKHLLYLSPYWTTYFFAYVDFDSMRGMKPVEVLEKSQAAAVQSMIKGQYSTTGEFWKCAIQYGPCLNAQ